MTDTIKDADKGHWTYRAPKGLRPYLQLARYDRPVGYWLLALPGWIGLAFASLSHGFASSDLKWAALILIGAVAMRGAGCTYNDIVDRDLDAQVDRTALRPLPAGTVTLKQTWIWLFLQCAVGLVVLLCLPRLAQIISLCAIPLVAAYPFMKRITWWPQVWLGMTFNWAVLVAYAAKTEIIAMPVMVLYAGLIFWTIGYDTIYACQDIEDDMKIGIKSTARKFESRIKVAVGMCYVVFSILVISALALIPLNNAAWSLDGFIPNTISADLPIFMSPAIGVFAAPMFIHLICQVQKLDPEDSSKCLQLFKSNLFAAFLLIGGLSFLGLAHLH